MSIPRLALTCGEPAGIGPDLALTLALEPQPAELVAIADPGLLRERAALLGLRVELCEFDPTRPAAAGSPGRLSLIPLSLAAPCSPGLLDPANSRYVLASLERAVAGCMDGEFDAMVTAPVQKSVINDAGIPFTGHTEYLQAITGTGQVVKMLTAGAMRVALATTHLALADVPAAIDRPGLRGVLEVLESDLRRRFGLARPRIAVLGLNPHAGEGGHLGREEIEVITPVIDELRGRGFDLRGPLPADTAFNPEVLDHCDAVLAMYHDQGLPVLKYAGFGSAVNITLGLPLVRTSVDHGTALDLAGTGKADPGSLRQAIRCAVDMVRAGGD